MASETKDLGPEVDTTPAASPDNTIPLIGTYVTLVGFTSDEEYTSLWNNLRPWENSYLFDYIPGMAHGSKQELREKIQGLKKRGFVVYAIKGDPGRVNPGGGKEGMGHGEVLGIIAYLNIFPDHRELEVGGVVFSPILQRSAAATEVNYLLLKNALEPNSPSLEGGGNSLPYRRVCWKCNSLNTKSRRAAERLGYVFEGRFRKHRIVRGRSRDSDWLSVVDDEWPVVKGALEGWLDGDNFDGEGRQVRGLEEIRETLVKEGVDR